MARLFMAGAELIDPVAERITTSSTVEYTTEEVRTGQYSYKITSSGTSSSILQVTLPSTAGNEVYVRGYFKFASFSPNDMPIIYMTQGAGFYSESLVINSSGVLGWRRSTFTPDFSATGPTISLNTWHRIEYSVFYDNSLGGSQWIIRRNIRVDGIPYTNVSTSLDTVSNPFWSALIVLLGWVTTEGTITPKVMYLDDIAINDSGGSEQNSWPGEGSIGILLSESDELRGTGWTGINGTETTNLYTFYWPKLGTEPTSVRLHHNFGSATSYLARFNSLASIGVTDNSQIKVVQRALAAGKISGTNTVRTGSFGMTDHPTWPTVNVNPPNLLTASTTPNNWQFHNVIDTNPSYWSAANWDINQPSRFTFRRTNTTSNHLVFRYAVVLVEFKKPIEVETELSSTSSLISTIQRQRSADEVLSAASNYVLTSARQRTNIQTLSSTSNTLLASQIERSVTQALSSTTLWSIFGSRERSLIQPLSSTSNFTSTLQRQRFGLQALTVSSDVNLASQRLRFLEQELTASSNSYFGSVLEAVGKVDLVGSSSVEMTNARERQHAISLLSNADAIFDAMRELYSGIDFASFTDLSQAARRERATDVSFSGRSNFILSTLFEILFEMALDATSSFSSTSAIEATFSGTWLSASDLDADSVAERMTAFGLTSASTFDSLFLRERSDDLHTSATTDLEMPISRERSSDLDFDAASLLALLSLLERQGIMGLSADTDFDLFASTLKSSGIFLTGETALDIESVRERWVAFDAAASTEFSGLAQAIYASGLTMTGNSVMFVTSEAGGLILAEMALNADGSFTIEAIRNLTNSIDLSTNSDLDVASLIRERAFSLNYSSESVQSLLSTIEAVGDLSFDSATDFTIAQERERSLSAAFDAQSGILVPFERLRSVAVPYSASGTLSLSLDLTVLGQLYFQSTGTLLSEAVRELGGTLPLDSTGTLDLQSARELSASLGLESTGYLAITYHSIEYIPSIEYYFKHRGNRFFRNIPIREMLVPVLREPWFNEFHIEQQLQTKDLLPFFIKIDRDDR